jgi:sugar (pentulose or hexulose) kinase
VRPALLIALDVGTTGVKASLVDPQRGVISTSYQEHRPHRPRHGWVEQSPAVIDRCVSRVLRQVGAALPDRRSAAAIAVTSARATVSLRGPAAGPFVIWQDQRSTDECRRIAREVGEDRYSQITGLPLAPVASASKVAWLRRNDPDGWRHVTDVVTAQGHALLHLGARLNVAPRSMAAYVGLLDLRRGEWSDELCRAVGVALEQLPELVDEGAVVGSLSAARARALGLVTGTPLIAAPSDWASTMAGAGAFEDGQAVAYLGTGGALGVATAEPRLDPARRMSCLPSAVGGRFAVEGLLITGAASYGWLRGVLAVRDDLDAGFGELERLARKATAGSNGTLTLPAFEGSGAPLWDADARGVILGMSLGTTRGDLVRSMIEGVAMELRSLVASLGTFGVGVERLVLTGPPAASRTWSQVVSDVLGAEVGTVHPSDPTMVGAAAVASTTMGIVDRVEVAVRRMTRHRRTSRPDEERTKRYRAMADLAAEISQLLHERGVTRRMAQLGSEGT